MVVLGEAMSHPSSGKLTTEQLDEIGKLADEALDLEKKSDGKEWWRNLEPKSNTTLFRILKLKGLVDGRTKVSLPTTYNAMFSMQMNHNTCPCSTARTKSGSQVCQQRLG